MQCTSCGREVRSTVHQKEGKPPYWVDYYRLLTGKLSQVVMQNPRDESEVVEFYKLAEPRWVITCADCMAREEVRQENDRLFRGVPENGEERPSAG